MKNFLLLCAFILFSCSNSDDGYSSTPPIDTTPDSQDPPLEEETVLPDVSNIGFDFSATDIEGWELVWEDNFNEGLSDWNVWEGGAFNEELQLYREDNLYVDKGYLFIEQLREMASGATNPFDTANKSFNFTSGRIETKELYNPSLQGTLRIAARIKLPAGEGLWPAFWSYGDPWPTQGEIDIVEFRGGKTNELVTNFFYGTQANTPLTNSSITTYTHDAGIDLTTEFHVFDMVWSQNSLVVSLDGVEIRTFTTDEFQYIDDLFNKNEKVVLNLAVGGAFFNGMNLNAAEIPDKSYLIVDWVKIYKQ
ncbi:family 16 glycosylhydrolase [Maribacter sp. 2308TA10-17]|uniref:glycoside hydrolase family 16 protein n=1 Tax=Maribacter sp. 2308TA10-17 TaxID=3386276 RepID=UPI0039BD3E06